MLQQMHGHDLFFVEDATSAIVQELFQSKARGRTINSGAGLYSPLKK
jgi:hypothetical protein